MIKKTKIKPIYFLLIAVALAILGVIGCWKLRPNAPEDFPLHETGSLSFDEIIIIVNPGIDIENIVKRHGDDPSTITQARGNEKRLQEHYVIKVGKDKRLQKLEEYQKDPDVVETSVNPGDLLPPL